MPKGVYDRSKAKPRTRKTKAERETQMPDKQEYHTTAELIDGGVVLPEDTSITAEEIEEALAQPQQTYAPAALERSIVDVVWAAVDALEAELDTQVGGVNEGAAISLPMDSGVTVEVTYDGNEWSMSAWTLVE